MEEALKEKVEELKGEPVVAAAVAVLVGDVMASDSSSSWTLAMFGERAELKPPKGPEPPGKVDSAMIDWFVMPFFVTSDLEGGGGRRRQRRRSRGGAQSLVIRAASRIGKMVSSRIKRNI